MSTAKTLYPAGTATISITPENIPSSSGLNGGYQSDPISNVTNLDLDHLVSGFWTSGTGPSTNTQVQAWIIPCVTDDLASTQTWPNFVTGAKGQIQISTAGMLTSIGRLGGVLLMDTATTNRTYYCDPFSVADLFGGVMPTRYVLFLTHNTGVNSNTTAGNFVWEYQRLQGTVA